MMFSESQATMQDTMQATMQDEQVLVFCLAPKSRSEIQTPLGLKNRDHVRKSILNPSIESGKLLLTLPDKPTSPKQKFYKAMSKNYNAHEGDNNE